MKILLIILMTNYGGSISTATFYDKQACDRALEDLRSQEGGAKLKGGCYPLAS